MVLLIVRLLPLMRRSSILGLPAIFAPLLFFHAHKLRGLVGRQEFFCSAVLELNVNHVFVFADFGFYDLSLSLIVVVDRLAQPVFFGQRVVYFGSGGKASTVSVGAPALRAKLGRVIVKVPVRVFAKIRAA